MWRWMLMLMVFVLVQACGPDATSSGAADADAGRSGGDTSEGEEDYLCRQDGAEWTVSLGNLTVTADDWETVEIPFTVGEGCADVHEALECHECGGNRCSPFCNMWIVNCAITDTWFRIERGSVPYYFYRSGTFRVYRVNGESRILVAEDHVQKQSTSDLPERYRLELPQRFDAGDYVLEFEGQGRFLLVGVMAWSYDILRYDENNCD